MRVLACGITHIGNVRAFNEDAFLLSDVIIQRDLMEKPICIERKGNYFVFAVADGMGGHPEGEKASLIVLEELKRCSPSDEEEINKCLHAARDKLEEYALENPHALGLGCAVAGLVISSKGLYAFNVGDCRVYGIKDGKLFLLTQDHRIAYYLTSALVGDPNYREFEVFIKRAEGFEGFLICSDGLWEYIEDETDKDLQTLLSIALDRGGADNLTAVKVSIMEV
ncbi:PP2C family protein-serine/threonine phosphatase [Thermocrinis minervae]|uniref:Protein phosphatase n=1 Tax=Thermocrinis minervae TaxID=381751 RepID=A0A1M6R527_9AQUI|nr:PP2C family serine/threonine-protein phosphatase [Thermocrinis minervae]SHK27458.1 protein phosphatase [Thermocrinis minervae]